MVTLQHLFCVIRVIYMFLLPEFDCTHALNSFDTHIHTYKLSSAREREPIFTVPWLYWHVFSPSGRYLCRVLGNLQGTENLLHKHWSLIHTSASQAFHTCGQWVALLNILLIIVHFMIRLNSDVVSSPFGGVWTEQIRRRGLFGVIY